MHLKPFTLDEIKRFRKDEKFILIPRYLYREELHYVIPQRSKFFYGVLLEKYILSEKMNWIDEDGLPYILCSRDEMGDMMCCGKNPIAIMKRHLRQAGVYKTKLFGSRTWRIYLLHPDDEEIF